MAKDKAPQVQFENARDIVLEHIGEQEVTASWPKKCATGRILIQNEEGKIISTDLFFSVEVDEKGQFNDKASNPVAIHNTDNGTPKHEYLFVRSKDQRGNVRPWFDKLMSALTARFFDHHTPAIENPAQEAKSPEAALASPGVEMPT